MGSLAEEGRSWERRETVNGKKWDIEEMK